MGTYNDNTLAPSNASAALFRAWGAWIHSVLSGAGGWTVTADTGQIDFTTVAAPGAVSTYMGYKMYTFSDALNATYPIYVKIEFGSSSASANNPSIQVTIGTGSNGTGTITGTLVAAFQHGIGGTASAGVTQSYGSSGPARAGFAIFTDAGVNNPLWFSLERTVDTSGSDTGDGLILNYGRATNACVSRYIPRVGAAPPTQTGMHAVMAAENPSTFGINVGVSLCIPMAGVAKSPGLNLLQVRSGDFGSYSTITCPVYGTMHTYQHVGAGITGIRNNGDNALLTTNRLAIRYE
jgi:hypothetical protein